MKTARFIQMGRLGMVLGLCVACEGQMRSLGDLEAGGTAGSSTQGKGGNDSGGAGVGGGGIGGTGVAGNVGASYVQDPSLPIDPTCTCNSPNEICNAARQCVPRCDSAGRCAMWLSPHGVKDLHVDGATVYILTAMASDPLGNPIGEGSLYRADYPNGTPTLIATGIKDPSSILGRYNGATLIETGDPPSGIIRVTDAGIASGVIEGTASSMRGNWLTYAGNSAKRLWGIDLDGDLVPQLLADLDTIANLENDLARYIEDTQVLDDYFWFATASADRVCYLDRANLALGPTCNAPVSLSGYQIFAASGNQLFGIVPIVSMRLYWVDITFKERLTLFQGEFGSIPSATYSDGWLYSILRSPKHLVRYPATVGRLPQEILPANIVTRAFFALHGDNLGGGFGVGSIGVVWFQDVTDLNQPQYVFHTPLPPQPCDAELPCADGGQICVDGYCRAVQ